MALSEEFSIEVWSFGQQHVFMIFTGLINNWGWPTSGFKFDTYEFGKGSHNFQSIKLTLLIITLDMTVIYVMVRRTHIGTHKKIITTCTHIR